MAALKTIPALAFPQEDEDFDFMKKRGFRSWISRDNTEIYQGQVDFRDRPDGRGVLITPGDSLEICYFDEGLRHGPFLEINNLGETKQGTRYWGCLHRTVTVTQADGGTVKFLWNNGEFVRSKTV